MSQYIMSVDQGTTSSRAILFDQSGRPCVVAQCEFEQLYPQSGWVEHDPLEILKTQIKVMREVADQVGSENIKAIGITNQRETIVVWDRETGEPVYNAIVWQCRRTTDFCQQWRHSDQERQIQSKTGLLLDPYFSASKIRWILENVKGTRERAHAGHLCFGTIDAWLIYNFSGKKNHVTDVSNASRTMLYNIQEMAWDPSLFDFFDIPQSMAPQVLPSSGQIASCTTVFVDPIPICGIAGDQQAALFGQGCFNSGEMKNTYGTGCFLLCNIGHKPLVSKHRLLTTVGWQVGDDVTYCLEGSVFIGGAVIQWLRDELELISSAAESESMAKAVDSSENVYVVPAFTGLGAPHWDAEARGIITGISRGTNRKHIVRAALESIAYQCRDLIDAMANDLGAPLAHLRVDGGATVNNFLMQFQADMIGIPVDRAENAEVTALGAALLAGLGCGFWASIDDLPVSKSDSNFQPNISDEQRKLLLLGWHAALKRARST